MMTTRLWLLPLLILLLVPPCYPAGLPAGAPPARLLQVRGLVKVRPAGGDWRRAYLPQNRDLWGRDEVQTHQRASAVIGLDGKRLEMGPLTHIVIPAGAPKGASVRSRLRFVTGKLLILLIGGRPLEIGTAGATASARGTRFLIETNEAGLTILTVIDGSVDFHNDLGAVLVAAGEQSTAAPGQAPSRPMRVDPSAFLDWEVSPESLWLGFEKLYRPDLPAKERETLLGQAATKAQAAATDPAALTAYADLLHDGGNLTLAEETYDAAATLAPANADLRLKIAFNLLAQGRDAEAAKAFAEAAQAPALKGLATTGQAVAALGSADDQSRAQAQALAAQARALSPKDAQVAVMAGFVFLRTGQLDPAVAALTEAAQLDPKEYRAPAYLALARLAQGQTDAARQAAQAAVATAPASALAHEAMATTAFYAGSLAQAGAEADLVLQADPNSAAGHLLAAQVAAAQGDLRTALDHAQTALVLDPQLPMIHQTIGMLCLALNDVAGAEKAFRRALELQPKMASAMTGLGQVLARQDQFAAALQAQQAALALDPSLAAGHNNLGAAYLQSGHLDEAVAEFDRAVKLQPDWALVHGNLALAYLELNRFAEAVQEGELAVKLGGQSARLYTTLGRVYLKQDRVTKAWAALRQALELDPNYPLARMHLAEVYTRLGLDREANRERLRAMSQQPSVMMDSRAYARTELSGALGSVHVQGFTSGRGDHGQNSFYVAAAHDRDDWDRPRTDFQDTSVLALAGRQTDPDHTLLLMASFDHDRRDLPGRALAGNLPSDLDDTSTFDGRDFELLSRFGAGRNAGVTMRLGYRDASFAQDNPDSLMGDPSPLRRLELERRGPQAELRLDARPCYGDSLIAGFAWHSERRRIAGLLTTPPPPFTYAPFVNDDTHNALTGYVDWEDRLNERTWLLLGGRAAFADDMNSVWRPRARLRYQASRNSNLVLVTRPVLADDVSELSPNEEWGTRFWMSPVDLARGGYNQTYELQYEVQPRDGSLFRAAVFRRDMRNLIVDLQDPAWAVSPMPVILDKASAQGVEAEYERWLGHGLSAGVWVRFTDSSNDDAGGLDIPYQPTWLAQARLDYLDESGWRARLLWSHVGERFADIANTTKLSSYNRLDLSVARQFNVHTDVFVTVENLLNEQYEFFQDYPGRDLRVTGGVRHRF